MVVVGKVEIAPKFTHKEDFIQDYCHKGERLNSTLLRQMAGEFLSTEVS